MPYVYGDNNWKDKVTSIGGKSITYDAIGNPLTYDGWAYEWEAGRQLKRMMKSGTDARFTYDHNGLRVKKVVGSTETRYILNGKQIAHMEVGPVGGAATTTMHFWYDVNGKVAKCRLNGVDYLYQHNMQGDVIGLLSSNGSQVVRYRYDAWGKQISCTGSLAGTLGVVNPFRYRGYVFDEETGLYYLRSRYYNPVWGRFISIDDSDILNNDFESVFQYNLYVYCWNNPIIMDDGKGTWPNWVKAVIGVVATVAAVAITVATGGAAAPVLVGVAVSTLSGGAVSAINHRVSTGNWEGAGQAALDGAADGLMYGGISAFASSGISAIKAVNVAKKGVTIGRNMEKVRVAAQVSDTGTYEAMKGYNFVKRISPQLADKLSLKHNEVFINRMIKLGAPIYDSGLNGATSVGKYYGMELIKVKNYFNYIKMY